MHCCAINFLKKHQKQLIAVVSFFALLPVAIIGFMMLLQSKHNFTLFFISIYLMVLLVLKRGRFFRFCTLFFRNIMQSNLNYTHGYHSLTTSAKS